MASELVNVSDLGMKEEELFTHCDSNIDSEKITAPRYSYWHSVFRVFFKKKINIVVLAILAFIIIFSYIYPIFSGYDAYANLLDSSAKHLSPAKAIDKWGFSLHTILGTGGAGQSTFDAIWHGAEISLSLAFVCALINMTVGVTIGALWGFSKKVDAVMMVVYNIIGNVPYILLISVLVMLFTASFWSMVFAMTITGWIGIAYFIRTQVVIIRDREYNLASRCLGSSTARIAVKNILPFMISFIVTIMAQQIPAYIASEAFLSYIGLGISDTTLGKILFNSQSAMVTPGWGWEFWCPVMLSAFISVVLFLIGQNLGDAADPRTHM